MTNKKRESRRQLRENALVTIDIWYPYTILYIMDYVTIGNQFISVTDEYYGDGDIWNYTANTLECAKSRIYLTEQQLLKWQIRK